MSDLFKRAKEGDVSVLNSPDCSIVKDENNYTPLHWLARRGKIEVLSHPDCTKVKDENNYTPLHWLARKEKIEVLSHPDCTKVKDVNNYTPLHWLVLRGVIEVSHLKELFPWYKTKFEGQVFRMDIDEILEIPQSIQFILSEE